MTRHVSGIHYSLEAGGGYSHGEARVLHVCVDTLCQVRSATYDLHEYSVISACWVTRTRLRSKFRRTSRIRSASFWGEKSTQDGTTVHRGEMHEHGHCHPASVFVDACYVLSTCGLGKPGLNRVDRTYLCSVSPSLRMDIALYSPTFASTSASRRRENGLSFTKGSQVQHLPEAFGSKRVAGGKRRREQACTSASNLA